MPEALGLLVRRCLRALLVAFIASGCAQVIGTDDYRVADDRGAGAEGRADAGEPPILPAVPDESRIDECEECVRLNCVDERATCLSSERCVDMLRCMGGREGCHDPDCIAACTAALPESPFFWDYFGCAFNTAAQAALSPTTTRCFQECGAGDNWECREQFRWSLPEVRPEVDVQLFEASGALGEPSTYPGWQITACVDFEVTDPPGYTGCGEWQDVGVYGTATMTFEGEGAGRPEAFALRSVPIGPSERRYGPPVVRPGHVTLGLVGRPIGALLSSGALSYPYDGIVPILTVAQLDCLGVLAPSFIDIENPSDQMEKRCYEGQETMTIGSTNACPAAHSIAIFMNVPASWNTTITATNLGGETISRRSVLTASRWFTTVNLYPMDEHGN